MKRAAVFLMAVFLCTGLILFPALAEVSLRDGIEVSLSTDRNTCASWEKFEVTVNVRNTNSFAVQNAELELSASQGFQFADGGNVELGELQPNVIYQFITTASNPDALPPVPQTGDSFPMLPLAAGVLLSIIGFVALRRAGVRRGIALLLCISVVGGAAQAAIIRKSFSVSNGMMIDGQVATITATLHYDFEGVKTTSYYSSRPKSTPKATLAPTPTPKPQDYSDCISFPDLVDLNLTEGVTITAEGLPKLKSNQAVYVYADCSFELTTEDGEHEVPFVLRRGDEPVEADSPAVIFTQDGTEVITIELQPPKNMPGGVYNGSIEFRTETVANYKPSAQ